MYLRQMLLGAVCLFATAGSARADYTSWNPYCNLPYGQTPYDQSTCLEVGKASDDMTVATGQGYTCAYYVRMRKFPDMTSCYLQLAKWDGCIIGDHPQSTCYLVCDSSQKTGYRSATSAEVTACRTYAWNSGPWGTCRSDGAGGGTQSRAVVCENGNNQTVPDSDCSSPEPPSSQACQCASDPEVDSLLSQFQSPGVTSPYDEISAASQHILDLIENQQLARQNMKDRLFEQPGITHDPQQMNEPIAGQLGMLSPAAQQVLLRLLRDYDAVLDGVRQLTAGVPTIDAAAGLAARQDCTFTGVPGLADALMTMSGVYNDLPSITDDFDNGVIELQGL
jgi:hypothetical protein